MSADAAGTSACATSLPLLLVMALTAAAQDQPVISVDVDLVNVFCSVRDARGEYVRDLSKDDFEILDDGQRREITHFAREADSPLTVALLLDVSGSVIHILETEKRAAARFFREVLRPGDRAMLAGFAQSVAVWQDVTPSKSMLEMALNRAGPLVMRSAETLEVRWRGGTLLYDAVNLVAVEKLKRLPGRKAIVIITDGEDYGSLVTLANAGKAAQEADAVVYGIHYEERPGRYRGGGLSALEKLAEPTGGRTFHVDQALPLESVFDAIGGEMRNQYSLAFTPGGPEKAGEFHQLEVKVSRPGLKVQARSGYFGK